MFRLRPANGQQVLRAIVSGRLVSARRRSHNQSQTAEAVCAELNAGNANVRFEWKTNGSLRVQLANAAKRNAMNLGMYQSIGQALKFASDSEQVKCVIFEGKDGVYSSGNDLSYLRDIPKSELQSHILRTIHAMDEYIHELIEIRKPIVAAVDGPAIGIGCSTLGLFDSIIASSRSSFWTPFSKIALVPEGCSSYTFPRILGSIRANRMLLFNHKLDARQAFDWGFIGQLIERPDEFGRSIDEFEEYLTTQCNSDSLIEGKRLVRSDEIRAKLREVNETEGRLMKQFWTKPAYQDYLAEFYKKNKS